jgi:hypothetical protein
MGGGAWSTNTYTARTSALRAAGYQDNFAHDADIRSGKTVAKVHESLDPAWLAGDASPNAGTPVREAFDGPDHPNSTPIAVAFDETGSMGQLPKLLQEKLPNLHGLLQRKGYVEDPQLLFAAVGDAEFMRERAPYQIGQFESDNRGDEQLENFYLEGNGGGQMSESYAGIAYFLAYHTDLDSVKKRGKKGYLFFIGDEMLKDRVTEAEIRRYMGDKVADVFKQRFPEADHVPTEQIFRDLQEKFEVWYLFCQQGSYTADLILPADAGKHRFRAVGGDVGNLGWQAVLPASRTLVLEEAAAVCETIGLIIGTEEGTVDLDEGMDDLRDVGADEDSVLAAGKALAPYAAQAGGGAQLATVGGAPDLS